MPTLNNVPTSSAGPTDNILVNRGGVPGGALGTDYTVSVASVLSLVPPTPTQPATLGPSLAYSPAAGTVDPGAGIAGFATGTGRLNVTLAGNTTFQGLPAGFYDGMTLTLVIVGGNYTLTLSAFSGGTVGAQFCASAPLTFIQYDAVPLYYDGGLGQWIIQY